LSALKVNYPFIAFMPQLGFSQFSARQRAKRFSSLKVMMNADATDLIWSGDYGFGVKVTTPRAARNSRRPRHRLRRPAFGGAASAPTLRSWEIGAPMDVLWFRAGKREGEKRKCVRTRRRPAR